MAAPGHIITRILPRDSASSIWKFMGGIGRIGVAIVVPLIPLGLVYLFLRPESDGSGGLVATFMDWLEETFLGASSEGSQKSATDVLDFMERFPTEPAFYYSIAVVAGAYLGWRWWLYAKLRKEFERAKKENEDKSCLTSRDWWVVQGLRERALALRIQAGWILGGMFLLLFMGIYFVIFVLLHVEEEDQKLRTQIERQHEEEIGGTLDLIFGGRYWLKIPENLSKNDEQKLIGEVIDEKNDVKNDVKITEGILKLKMENIEENWNLSENWISSDLSLKRGEKITAVTISADGGAGVVVGDKDSVFLTRDNGENWRRLNLPLEHRERVTAVTISADGGTGVVAGNEGSVLLTRDGGENWRRLNLSLERTEWVIEATFNADGGTGVVAGDEGSVLLTRDGGENWRRLNLSLERTEWVIEATFSANGGTGVVAGDEGSVFLTRDGGENWRRLNLSLERGERVTAVTISADGGIGVVAGDEGSVFLTRDGGENWRRLNLSLERGERVTAVTFSTDGGTGVVAGDEGSVFLTRDGGENWRRLNLSLERGERVTAVTISAGGNAGMIYRIATSVSLKRDGEENWNPLNLFFRHREQHTASAFSRNGNTGVVAGDKGSVFLTRDGGENWISLDLSLERTEWVIEATFSADGGTGVVAGDEGSVFLTRDGGESWEFTGGEDLRSHDSFSSVRLTTEDVYVAETSNRETSRRVRYILKNYKFERPESLTNILKTIEDDAILKNSSIYKQIGALLDKRSIRAGDNGGGWFFGILENLTVMRTVTLVALFFLIHILVRLHQYSLRLAAFWDARADAVLLARSFAYHRAETFDDLVAALAPDAHDFKPSPKSGHEAVTHLAGQLLRRESRKS